MCRFHGIGTLWQNPVLIGHRACLFSVPAVQITASLAPPLHCHGPFRMSRHRASQQTFSRFPFYGRIPSAPPYIFNRASRPRLHVHFCSLGSRCLACLSYAAFIHSQLSFCFLYHFLFNAAILSDPVGVAFTPACAPQARFCFLSRFYPGCPVPLRQEGCCHNPFHFLCSPPAAIRGCVPFALPCCVHCLSHCIPVHMSIAHRPVLSRPVFNVPSRSLGFAAPPAFVAIL